MRILHVVQPPYGGAVATVLLLARDQVEHHDVGVVCHTAGNAADVARGLGAAVWTIPTPRAVRLTEDMQHLVRLRRIIRQFHPDIVHVHSSKAGTLGRLAARFERVPVVFSPQNFAFRAYEGSAVARGVFYAIERALAPLTDCLHTVSDDEYENAVRHGMAPSHRCGKIHNAIDLAPLLRLDPPPVRRPPVIGTFARLYGQKRLDLFLDALAELLRRDVPFRGLLIGDGPLRARLRAHAEMLGLQHAIEFDASPHDAVAALSRIDIFALTSSHEACPLTVMEAMAAERAVAVSRVGMIPELLGDERAGLIFEPNDAAAIADALQRLVEDISLRQAVAAAGREKARRRFAPELMSRRMEALYATALGRRG